MRAVRRRHDRGMTLVELSVAILILAVASVGTMSYQYHAARRASMARAEITAMQLGRLLIEDWKSRGGEESYDPAELNMGITSAARGEPVYRVTMNGFPMWITLWHQDMMADGSAGVTLRQIRVTVQWKREDAQEKPSLETDPTYVTATYVRRDEAGG